jgi:hypothetical protein
MNADARGLRWSLVAFCLFCLPVGAEDFRVLDFGSSCAALQELEQATGSKPLAGVSAPNIQGFKGLAFDREASIVYVCKQGKFALGNYFFPGQHFDGALKNLHDVYDNLTAKYGAPFLNNSPWQAGPNKDPAAVASDPSKYSVTWRTERVDTTISLVSNGDTLGATWEVIVVVGPGTL